MSLALSAITGERISIKVFEHLLESEWTKEEGERFFVKTLPFIQQLVLSLPEVFPAEEPLPLLLPQQETSLTLTQVRAYFRLFLNVD